MSVLDEINHIVADWALSAPTDEVLQLMRGGTWVRFVDGTPTFADAELDLRETTWKCVETGEIVTVLEG